VEEDQTVQWPKEEDQTVQWPKEEGEQKETMVYVTLHRKLKIE
jgi:hypothetical protein